MTPIDQVRPALPGNTIRRPDARHKPSVAPVAPERRKKDSSQRNRDQRPGAGEHIVDELA